MICAGIVYFRYSMYDYACKARCFCILTSKVVALEVCQHYTYGLQTMVC